MILKTNKKNPQLWFLVLVPHRDTRLVLRKWSGCLFREGFCGAYSFPWVAPLALLSRPFGAAELARCARAIREETLCVNGGKITGINTSHPSTSPGTIGRCEIAKAALFGPCLDFCLPSGAFSESAREKIDHLFLPAIIGACLLRPDDNSPIDAALPPPRISFRAAALANMSWRSLQGSSAASGAVGGTSGYFNWKIGKLCWLPPVTRSKLIHGISTNE